MKRDFIIVIVILLASLSWVLLPIPILNKHFALVPSEVLLILLFYLMVYTNHVNGFKFKNLGDTRYFKNILTFLIIYLALTCYHIFENGFNIQYFMHVRYILAGILTYLLLSRLKLNIKGRYNALLFAVTIINIIRLYRMSQGEVVRASSFMINIIIYITFLLICYPVVLHFSIENTHRLSKLTCLASYFNIICIVAISPFSGSRTCNAVLIGINFAFVFFLVIQRKNKALIKYFIIIISALAILMCNVILTTNNESKSNVLRAFGLDKIITTATSDIRKIDKDTLAQKVGSISFFEEKNADSTEVIIRESDQVRSYYWNSAIASIKANPILGSGHCTIEYNGTYQSPHNFVLELLMSFGIIGTIFALKIIFYPLSLILKEKSGTHKFYSLLISFAFFSVSFFQPTMMTVSLVIAYYCCIDLFLCEARMKTEQSSEQIEEYKILNKTHNDLHFENQISI